MKKILLFLSIFILGSLEATNCRNDFRNKLVFSAPRYNFKMTVGLCGHKKFIFYFRERKEANDLYNDLVKNFDLRTAKTIYHEHSWITLIYSQISYIDLIEL